MGLELNFLNDDRNAYNDDEFRYRGNYGDDPLDGYEDHQEGDHDIDQETFLQCLTVWLMHEDPF